MTAQSSLLLSHGARGETAELTAARQRKRQIEVLSHMRVPFVVAGDGWPRVFRAHVERLPAYDLRAEEPDFSSLARSRSRVGRRAPSVEKATAQLQETA